MTKSIEKNAKKESGKFSTVNLHKLRKIISDRLITLKERGNFSQKEMAIKCEISADTLSKAITQKETLSIRSALKISENLGVSLDYIYGNSDVVNIPQYALDMINKQVEYKTTKQTKERPDIFTTISFSKTLDDYFRAIDEINKNDIMSDELKEMYRKEVTDKFISSLKNDTDTEKVHYEIQG